MAVNDYYGERRQIAVNGAVLTVVEAGSGLPVVFVHGSFSDHRAWSGQYAAVSGRYRFVAMDLRYYGDQPWDDEGEHFSPQIHVDDLAALIDALGAGPVCLVGRSYGSTIALATALQHPGKVCALFLNEPPVTSFPVAPADAATFAAELQTRDALFAAVAGLSAQRATALFSDWVSDRPGHFDTLSAAEKAMALTNARTVPLQFAAPGMDIAAEAAAGLAMPVSITHGALTRPFFSILARAAQRALPGSELHIVDGARHAVPSEQPEAFNRVLLEFLDRLEDCKG